MPLKIANVCWAQRRFQLFSDTKPPLDAAIDIAPTCGSHCPRLSEYDVRFACPRPAHRNVWLFCGLLPRYHGVMIQSAIVRAFRACLFAIATGLPAVASAESVGELTMFIDGEKRIWHAITMVQSGQTVWTATLQQRNHLTELQLQGHPVPRFTSKDVLSIDIRYPGQYMPGDEPASIEILYTPNGLSGPLWTSRGAKTQPRLQIVAFDIWGNAGELVAVVSGEICIRPRLFSRTDPTNCKRLNGKIETRLDVN